MGLLEDLQAIKDRSAALERRRARKEADTEVAQQRRTEALAALESEFGVSNVEEARKELDRLVAIVSADIGDAQAALEGVK